MMPIPIWKEYAIKASIKIPLFILVVWLFSFVFALNSGKEISGRVVEKYSDGPYIKIENYPEKIYVRLQDGYFKLKPNDNFSFIEKSFFQDLIDAMIFLLMIITFAAVSGAVDGVYEKRVSNE